MHIWKEDPEMARMRKSLMTLYRETLPLVQSARIVQENTRYFEILEKKPQFLHTEQSSSMSQTGQLPITHV